MPRFSKRAQRHATESKQRTKKMLRDARSKSGPVKISYLPGFEPPALTRTKYPFTAIINGRKATVTREEITYGD